MGYYVVADRRETDMMRTKYGPRQGLEGPFNFGGRVLYYDPIEGKHYDPRTDFYVDHDEMVIIRQYLIDLLRK